MSTPAIPLDFTRLSLLLQQHFGIEPSALRPDIVLRAAGMDTYAVLELAVILQDDFGAPVNVDDLNPDHTVGEVLQMTAA
ncbi:acyl carrier protein [Streptomyces olivaceoviridis]|uniref:acyl carrier protein n=1 Tax=Streptomyces olivaceoviridis TaxID=1921 RepID=UPI0036FFDE4C